MSMDVSYLSLYDDNNRFHVMVPNKPAIERQTRSAIQCAVRRNVG